MELKKVVVWEHSLERITNDLNRAKLLLGDVDEWLEGAMDTVDLPSNEMGGVWGTLHTVRAIIGLLSENLEINEKYIDKIVLDEAAPLPKIPASVNLDDFRDCDTAGLVAEFDAQCRTLIAARREAGLLALIVNQRGELPRQLVAG